MSDDSTLVSTGWLVLQIPWLEGGFNIWL